MFELAGIVAIMLLYVLRLCYKHQKAENDWKRIDKDWRPSAASRRSTNEFEGKS